MAPTAPAPESDDDGSITVRFRVDRGLWDRYKTVVEEHDPDTTRSADLRRYIRWCVGDIEILNPPRHP